MVKRALIKRDAPESRPLEYNQLPWGDLLYGTADQLRSIGIAVATVSRGEGGQFRRRQSLTDPRGFKCLIEACQSRGEGLFAVSIPLPGRQQPEPVWERFSRGVRRQANVWTDDYVGSADALVCAGLILSTQLPGQPGMRKVIVTVLPDGSVPTGARTCPAAKDSGAKSIRRVAKTNYLVSMRVDEAERGRRYAAYARSRREWEAQMRLLPRPAPLHARLLVLAPTANGALAATARPSPKPSPVLPKPASQKSSASRSYLRLIVSPKL
jgi:hypothetical protein